MVFVMKDDIVFSLYKDTPLNSKNDFIELVKPFKNQINVNDVYLRIVNYQVEKYGSGLYDKYDLLNHNEREVLSGKSKQKFKNLGGLKVNRKFDTLGRINIPKEMRDKIDLGENGSEAHFELVGNKIIVTNPKNNFDIEKYLEERLNEIDDNSPNWTIYNDLLTKIRA